VFIPELLLAGQTGNVATSRRAAYGNVTIVDTTWRVFTPNYDFLNDWYAVRE
jgi:hypothetical protein